MTLAERITTVVVVATPVLWLGWDVVAELVEPANRATESHFLWRLAERHHWFGPTVTAALNGLCLHWFWGFWRYR
ncbi:MAG: hypothetical protein P4L84_11105 [Isosphaeraceae bacterium]|nr:hypothetical protein [Isosphaeraceae bacterium]